MPAPLNASDEDFIPKSLMACVDAQADAEPQQQHFIQHALTYKPMAQSRGRNPHAFYAPYDIHDYRTQHFAPQLSQTPFGPHLPAAPASLAASTQPSAGEEISTIFVVGFPEDMQEREFQNMFTFSPGFEAATLKIPNKDYSAYPTTAPPGLRQGYQPYAPNDPYANDGWQDPDHNGHLYGIPGATQPALLPAQQRKQIIGFAKFRSRDEALAARDVLQGKRVDIEKGAVLKAEMAKKNLHTKRGVGPVPINGYPSQMVDDTPPSRMPWQHQPADSSSSVLVNGSDDDKKRDNALAMGITTLALTNGVRGPRERAEDEERERRWREDSAKEREMNLMRLRASNSAAFDAFHSVPASAISRQNSSGGFPPSNGSVHSHDSPNLAQAEPHVAGPWDTMHQYPPGLDPSYHPPFRTQSESSQTSAESSSVNGARYAAEPTPRPVPTDLSLTAVASGQITPSAQPIRSSNGTGGHTSPTLPSPTNSGGSASSTASATLNVLDRANGHGGPRGTIDQNPPINTLYVGNLPTAPAGHSHDRLEEVLREVFSQRPGFRKLCFRQKANGPMCFVEFDDVHYAAKAMAEMNGHELRGQVRNGGIRLSYSKNPLGVRTSLASNGTSPHHTQFHHQHLPQDSFQTRLADEYPGITGRVAIPPTILRRESSNGISPSSSLTSNTSGPSPTSSQPSLATSPSSGSFLSSPPPRFFATVVASTTLTGASSTFIPRGMVGLGGQSGHLNGFAPFSIGDASGTHHHSDIS